MNRDHCITPDSIIVPPGMRALNENVVARLVESIAAIGLQQPPTVRWEGDDLILVAGRHRLAACIQLGLPIIACDVFEGDATEARLWEIAENLHRAELTEAERRQHIAEWVRLTAEKVSHGGTPLPGGKQPKEEGIRKASKELGLPKSTVARAVAAESLPESVMALADEANLGTVVRAKIAREKSDVAKMRAALVEKEATEARRANQQTDRVVKDRRVEEIKEWLASRLDVNDMHDLGLMLAGLCDPVSRALMREAA